MRILLDGDQLSWEEAWDITQKTLAYTNHTLLPEALEKWSVPLLEKVLPRHMLIIFNINHRFLREMQQYSFLDGEKLRKMSIIEEGYEKQVRMAHLCMVGSHSVNGVSELHSDLIVTLAGSGICTDLAGEVQQQDQWRGAPALADEGQRGPDRPNQPGARRKPLDHRPGRLRDLEQLRRRRGLPGSFSRGQAAEQAETGGRDPGRDAEWWLIRIRCSTCRSSASTSTSANC